jgi:gamma-glutamyl-gamma-aminobutyrate hydrolase PuuD
VYVYIHDPFPNQFNEFVAEMEWTLTPTLQEAHIVVFTGGADVDPQLYGDVRHYKTSISSARDAIDLDMFNYCVENDLFMVGICRGGQFLNVMLGGSMVQDVSGHATREGHDTYIIDPAGELLPHYKYKATSTHHQMMIPGAKASLYAAAQGIGHKFAKKLPQVNKQAVAWTVTDDAIDVLGYSLEPECVAYIEEGALCFQPHPEYDPGGDTVALFRECWERFLEEQEGV